nr:MAG TPA: hypothetical protein [Caudoviricetes sp.]
MQKRRRSRAFGKINGYDNSKLVGERSSGGNRNNDCFVFRADVRA